jgi:hypothetical protein
MTTPTGPSTNDEDDRPFVAVARDPAGVTHHVQATVVSGGSGPVMIGGRNGPAAHGLLGLLNSFLAKTSKPKQYEFFGVLVTREDPTGPTVVAESDHRHMREARAKAQELVQAIEQGTFTPD